MSRIVALLTTIVGLNYFLACCNTEDRPPPHDPSKVMVVCANSGDAAQMSEEFDAGPASARPAVLTKENVYREACRTLMTFKCPESKKLPEGKDCETNLKDMAPVSPFDPYCVAMARSAAEIRKCPEIECKL